MKITNKCGKCGAEWILNADISVDKCPFCGASMQDDKSPQEFSDVALAIRSVIDMASVDILDKPKRFISMLRDILMCENRDINVITIAVNAGLYSKVGKATQNITLVAQNAINTLVDDYAMQQPIAVDTINWLLRALNRGEMSSTIIREKIDTPVKVVTPPRIKHVDIQTPAITQTITPTNYDYSASNSVDLNIEVDNLKYKIYGFNVKLLGSSLAKYDIINLNIPSRIVYNKVSYVVTEIADSAFSNCVRLSSVNFPDTIKRIGAKAFAGCKALETLEIPDNVMNLGEECFSGCKSLMRVSTPSATTTLPARVFSDCTALKYVYIGFKTNAICQEAFSNCSNLNNIHIPQSVLSIEKRVFSGCKNLVTINYTGSHKMWNSIIKDPAYLDLSIVSAVLCSNGLIKIK